MKASMPSTIRNVLMAFDIVEIPLPARLKALQKALVSQAVFGEGIAFYTRFLYTRIAKT